MMHVRSKTSFQVAINSICFSINNDLHKWKMKDWDTFNSAIENALLHATYSANKHVNSVPMRADLYLWRKWSRPQVLKPNQWRLLPYTYRNSGTLNKQRFEFLKQLSESCNLLYFHMPYGWHIFPKLNLQKIYVK